MTGRSANLLFVEVNRLGLQDQERISLFSLYRSGQAFRLHWERFYGMERPLLEVVPAPKRSNPGYTVQDRFLHSNRHVPIGYLFIIFNFNFNFFSGAHPQSNITRVAWIDNNTVVTTGYDSCVRLWDIVHPQSEGGNDFCSPEFASRFRL